jgi:hypothetical protein
LGGRPGSGGDEPDESGRGRSGGSRTAAPPKNSPPVEPDDDEIPF